MCRIVCLFCLLLGFAFYGSAQRPLNTKAYVDSLQGLLSQNISDSAEARVNFLLSEHWSYLDTLKAKQYLEKGRLLSQNKPYLQALYTFYAASLYFETDKQKSETTYQKAISLLEEFDDKEAIHFSARSWRSYGVLQQYKDDNKAYADILLTKVLPLVKESGDSTYLGTCYSDLGLIFTNLLQYEKAEGYYLDALAILEKVASQSTYLPEAYLYAAKNYIFKEEYPKAKPMLDKAREKLQSSPESDLYLEYYLNEGMYFSNISDYEEASSAFDKGIAMAKTLNKPYALQGLLFQQYKTFTKQQKYDKAKEVLSSLLNQEELMARDGNRLIMYYELSETNNKLGDMASAYKWLKRYSALSDSLSESKLKEDVYALETKYQTAEKEKKIAALQAEKEKMALAAQNSRLTNWLLGISCLFLLIIVAFSFFYYRSYKKDMEQQQQLLTINAMLQGEEKERSRLAKDLHDGLGGALAGIRINLSAYASGQADKEQSVQLNNVVGRIDDSISELRQIARNLMPEVLLKFGLETALRELCESINKPSLHIGFQAFNIEKTIPFPQQLSIYRIVQEMFANALRHAQATEILLQCSQNGNAFFLTIEDNGRGFDAQRIEGNTGMGLSSIKNRVAYLKGEMEISSNLNEGTAINIELNVAC